MPKRLIRVWNELDIEEVKKHLLVFGDLSAICSNCSEMGLKLDTKNCPKCKTEFFYVTFRQSEANMHSIIKLKEQNKNIIIIDYNDFKRMTGAIKAQEFFK